MRDELVQLDEVRVSQRRDGAKLALEPQRRVAVGHAAELDRDVHVEPQIAAEIDHTHASAAELAHDLIAVPDDLPRPTLDHGPARYRVRRVRCNPARDRAIRRRHRVRDARADAHAGADRADRCRARRTPALRGDDGRGYLRPAQRGRDDPNDRGDRPRRAPRGRTRTAVQHREGRDARGAQAGSISTAGRARSKPSPRCMHAAFASTRRCRGLPTRSTTSTSARRSPSRSATSTRGSPTPRSPRATARSACRCIGFTESFNLSVTVALAMSRIAARRRAAIGTLGDLEDTHRRELRARWFAMKIRGAIGVLERALT